ncbi:MAG: metallophosphoesterase family protein [Acidobacteriota bacterium]
MRFLVLSDIHSNLEALEAVLDRSQGEYDQVICCGDLVGYGPSPNEVTEVVRGLNPLIVRGNHDKAALGLVDLSLFNPLAKRAALWTQNALASPNLEYLRNVPMGPAHRDGISVVHGSFRDEDEYLLDLEEALQSLQEAPHPLTFFGHTHVQGGFVLFGDGRAGLLNPDIRRGLSESQLSIEPANKYLVNPGSVGQPRDYDPRAAFVIFDQSQGLVRYFRVPYPIERTQARMRGTDLPNYLIERLSMGR